MKHPCLVTCLGLLFITSSFALPEFVSQFPNGNASSIEGSGITCPHLGHQDCLPGAPRNPFGQDWDDNGRKWDKALCEKDSDGDGLSNGEELGDPCCEWTLANPTDLRQDQLSHPGEKDDDAAKSAPGCQTTTTAPPTTTTAAATTAAGTTAGTTATTTAGTTATTTAGTTATTTAGTTATTTAGTTAATTAGTTAATTGGTTGGTTAASTTAADTTPTTAAPGTTTSPTTTETTTTETTPTETTPTTTPDDDDGVCFPAHATVQLESGRAKRMDEVQIGDRVNVGAGQYSEVFLFTHKISDVHHEFVTIRTGTAEKVDASISLTKGHFIYANGKLITADQVKVGDTLQLHDGRASPVVDVECATFKGLYNPQTTHGDMMVDGVRVSTYTTVVHSRLAHSLLAPLRAIYRWIGWSPQTLEKGAPRIARILS